MSHKLYREFFDISEDKRITDQVFKIRISLSVLSMIVCCVALCATTFAWFTGQQNVQVDAIKAAEYSLEIEMDGTKIENEVHTLSLAAKDEHTLVIRANGTATTGYCVINVGGQTYSTVSIPRGESISLTIVAAQGEEITFSPNWGEYMGQQRGRCLGNDDRLEVSRTPYVTYRVADGVTLDQIVQHYGVSADDILLYNGISKLTVGQKIQIPNTAVKTPLVTQKNGAERKTEEETETSQETTTEISREEKEEITETEKEEGTTQPEKDEETTEAATEGTTAEADTTEEQTQPENTEEEPTEVEQNTTQEIE